MYRSGPRWGRSSIMKWGSINKHDGSRMWRHVDLVKTDFSEARMASIFRSTWHHIPEDDILQSPLWKPHILYDVSNYHELLKPLIQCMGFTEKNQESKLTMESYHECCVTKLDKYGTWTGKRWREEPYKAGQEQVLRFTALQIPYELNSSVNEKALDNKKFCLNFNNPSSKTRVLQISWLIMPRV
jgi:hypothetical protein